MRDTLHLRSRIALLASLPGLCGLATACNPPPKPQAVDQDEKESVRSRVKRRRESGSKTPIIDERRRKYYAEKAKREGKTIEEVTPPLQAKAEREAARRDAAARRGTPKGTQELSDKAPKGKADPAVSRGHTDPRLTRIPGDPPFIDGYNPEEEHCISGNWCGASEAVDAIAVKGVPVELECPTRIAGGKSSETIKADPKAYQGLSSKPNMQGSLNQHGTELARAKGSEGMCCYHWFNYCSGRPHLGQDGPVLAALEPGEAWSEHSLATGEIGALPDPVRERIAAEWLEDARAEHASVAAFARATLELMAVGAPPELLAQAQQAGLDEIDHARRCFALARRYGGDAMQPGALPALAPRTGTLEQLAADTFAEGCVGETIAALAVQRAARGCADQEVRAALEVIAEDEARHAALAWSTIAWALQQGGEGVAARLREIAAELRPTASTTRPADHPMDATLSAHGRLGARAHAMAADDAWAEIIAPTLEMLLAPPSPALREHPAPSS